MLPSSVRYMLIGGTILAIFLGVGTGYLAYNSKPGMHRLEEVKLGMTLPEIERVIGKTDALLNSMVHIDQFPGGPQVGVDADRYVLFSEQEEALIGHKPLRAYIAFKDGRSVFIRKEPRNLGY